MKRIPLHVREVMTRRIITVPPETDISQAVHLLLEHDISGLLVTDSQGGLIGVLTERDCIAVAAASGYYEEWGGPVAQYMSSPVETVHADDNLMDVAARMADSPHRRFPVVENGRLVGLLTRRDILRAIERESWSAPPDGSA